MLITRLDEAARQKIARLLRKAKDGGADLLEEIRGLPDESTVRFQRAAVVNIEHQFRRNGHAALTVVRGWISPPEPLHRIGSALGQVPKPALLNLLALAIATALPALMTETTKVARTYLKGRRNDDLKVLAERISALEAQLR